MCGGARTRYQEYSCVHGFGHAFMRIYGDELEPALKLCGELGERAAADCAQGAYHDYWFAVVGADDASLARPRGARPARAVRTTPGAFVRPCWYRAWLENRPATFAVEAPEDLDALCSELGGLQREACITAAAVIGPVDPAEQLRLCARLAAASDAASCVRGTKVQNLRRPRRRASSSRSSTAARGSARRRAAPATAGSGKAVAVLTDGAFARDGCPRLRARPPGARARRARRRWTRRSRRSAEPAATARSSGRSRRA